MLLPGFSAATASAARCGGGRGAENGGELAPKISKTPAGYLVVWTSMGQDGSREGVYGRFLLTDGTASGGEFRVNTTTVSQQMHPAVKSDGNTQFLVVWTSFTGVTSSFD